MVAIYRPAGRRPVLWVTGAGLRHVNIMGSSNFRGRMLAPRRCLASTEYPNLVTARSALRVAPRTRASSPVV
jgi:hypothetical protein